MIWVGVPFFPPLSKIAMLFAEFTGWNGFLGTRGSFMLDFVFLAMFAVIPVMAVSIALVRLRKNYLAHKRVQLVLAIVLLVSVLLFELDLRFFTDWEERADPSPYFTKGSWSAVWYALLVHLAFAVPTLFLWGYVVVGAIRNFASPTQPSAYSKQHRRIGWIAAWLMFGTGVTGWLFYWLAFVAS
jgi:uncharacterized membrane protein YozB (DUF420 family)